MAIVVYFYKNWGQEQLLELIENLIIWELGQVKEKK